MHHSAFEYDSFEELDASYLRLRERGIEPEVCIDHGMTLSYYYKDPDGNHVELQVDVFGDWDSSREWIHERGLPRQPDRGLRRARPDRRRGGRRGVLQRTSRAVRWRESSAPRCRSRSRARTSDASREPDRRRPPHGRRARRDELSRPPRWTPRAGIRELLSALDAGQLQELGQRAAGSGAARIPLAQAQLGAPVPDPQKIICIGLNYRDHAEETGQELPAAPMWFAKFANSLCGSGQPIVLPAAHPDFVDYEAELALIGGKAGTGSPRTTRSRTSRG